MKEKSRIGVFLCNCNGEIAGHVNYKPVIKDIGKLVSVEYIRESRNLCAFLEGELICKEIARHDLRRIVMAGCAKPPEELFLKKTLMKAGLDPRFLTMVDILGECVLAHERCSGMENKTGELIKMAVAKLENQETVETAEIPVFRKVLIIGGGLAGIETALELAQRGFEISLVEKEAALGGWLRRIHSVAGMTASPRKFLAEKLRCLQDYPEISVLLKTRPEEIQGSFGHFSVKLKDQKDLESWHNFGAIVWATGFETAFEPEPGAEDDLVGSRIISFVELEEMLARGYSLSGQRFTIILDDASENFQITSVLAVKNALLLRQAYQADVYLFHKNIKVGGDNWEKLYTEAREAGVNFFRTIEPLQSSILNGMITVTFTDPYIRGADGRYTVETDYLVMPDYILTSKDGLHPADPDNVHFHSGKTRQEGIYLAGSCRWPSLVNEIEASAKAVAGDIASRLSGDTVSVQLDQPRVDAAKCVVCLTCYRCCPHGAISIIHDESIANMYHSAAQMDPLACRRCGICAAECPGKAIQMPESSDAQVLAQIEALEV